MLDGAYVESDAEKELACQALKRYARSELDLSRHRTRISACYRYALPWRHGFDQSQPVDQLDDIYDDTLMTVVEDFAADMVGTFTPEKSVWCEMSPVEGLRPEIARQVKDQVAATQRTIFAEMSRSNLYQALQESYLDLAIGTMSLTIQSISLHEPFHCQAIPMTELRIDRGPYGFVDGWFRKLKRRCDDIKVLWPAARPPNGRDWETTDTEHEVVDGVWRVWSAKGDEVYQYVVLADSKLIYAEKYTGVGSNPSICARWSGDSTTAWGVGPTYRSMPTYQSLNHVRFLLLKKLDEITDPAFSFENDGVANFDNGLEPGTGIPRAIGSKAPEVIESKGRFDVTWMQADELTSAIKRAHYQDRPEQRGKTPPTAQQWMEESAERWRRMGTPATKLVIELMYPIIKRFAYLLLQRKRIAPLEVNGEIYHPLDPRFVQLTPTSPLLRAQEQEELLRIVRTVEIMVAQFGPQLAAVIVDIFKFAKQVQALLGTNVIRDEDKIKAAIEQLLPVLKAASGGGQTLDPASLVGPGG